MEASSLMLITNRLNLPAPVYEAIKANPYTRGDSDISVTDLIDSPRLVALRNAHADELEADASDLVYSLLGQAMHTVLERAGITSGKGSTESRLYLTIDGWKLSGQFDYIDEQSVLWDWKFVSTYEYVHGIKSERERQLNCYAALASANGEQVTGLQIGFIFRDWSKYGAEQDSSYPRSMAVSQPIRLWPADEQQRYLHDRIKLHQSAELAVSSVHFDNLDGFDHPDLVECTPEERWAKPEKWAVYKNANKRAQKLFDSSESAEAFAAASRTTYPKAVFKVDYRPGESTRCLHYCQVLKWCSQGKALIKGV